MEPKKRGRKPKSDLPKEIRENIVESNLPEEVLEAIAEVVLPKVSEEVLERAKAEDVKKEQDIS